MADKLKLMLVDDHYLVRMGLASIMALEPDVEVCAEASNGQEARALYRIHRPDVTLMDLRLPDISGTETLQAIRGWTGGTQVTDRPATCSIRAPCMKDAGGIAIAKPRRSADSFAASGNDVHPAEEARPIPDAAVKSGVTPMPHSPLGRPRAPR